MTNEAKYEQWVNLSKVYTGAPYSPFTTIKFEITGKLNVAEKHALQSLAHRILCGLEFGLTRQETLGKYRVVPPIPIELSICAERPGQSPDRLTQECQSVAKHHGWPQVVNEIQVGEAPSLAIVPEEPASGLAIRAASRALLFSLPTSQRAPRKPTLAEPTCLTPEWQRRHLWLECSKRGQSPGDCCGWLSWLRSYKCCELSKREKANLSPSKSLQPHLPAGSSLPSAQPSTHSPMGSNYSLVRTGNSTQGSRNCLLAL